MSATLQCAACRKRHALPLENMNCSRCGLDFSSLVEVREAATHMHRQAVRQLCQGAHEEAMISATESWNLKNDSASARLAYVLYLAQGDFESAEDWRSSAAL